LAITLTLNGVGEAFDWDEPNSSALVEAYGSTLLVDCGHSAVRALWRRQGRAIGPFAVDLAPTIHAMATHAIMLSPHFSYCRVESAGSFRGRSLLRWLLHGEMQSAELRANAACAAT
jgi:hypothetical protein